MRLLIGYDGMATEQAINHGVVCQPFLIAVHIKGNTVRDGEASPFFIKD